MKRRAVSGASPSPVVLATNRARPASARSEAVTSARLFKMTRPPASPTSRAVARASSSAKPVWLAWTTRTLAPVPADKAWVARWAACRRRASRQAMARQNSR
ncbi:hypothetical protein ASD89_12695 [Caulobacter sp. Root656]|nr:hypothetical protein ASD89_12695 [Caulobacter sp. Root656]